MDKKIVLLMAAIALLIVGCSEGAIKQSTQTVPAQKQIVPAATQTGTVNAEQQAATQDAPTSQQEGSVKEFNVEAFQYSFAPDTIEVSKGDKVKITLTTR